jgi:phosphoglycerate dehydrogenase-like enzyme
MSVWVPFVEAADRLGDADTPTFVYQGGRLPSPLSDVRFFVAPHPFDSASVQVTQHMPNLAAVQLLSSGFDHALPLIRQPVQVCNAPELHGAPAAETAMALLLAALNHLPQCLAAQRAGEWMDPGPRPRLLGKQVLLFGYGAVGQALHRMLIGFDADVVAMARHGREGVVPAAQLSDYLPSADVLIIAVPLANDTRGLIGNQILQLMKPGALLVNVSRGSVVDTDALLDHLQRRRICAALDVTDPEPLPTDHPLWACPNVIITPHIGGNTVDFRARAAGFIREQVMRHLSGRELLNIVRPVSLGDRPAERTQ